MLQGGQLVGAGVAGRRVLIVDDVITAGTAIREAVELLRAQGAEVVAVSVCLDRQEKTAEASTFSAIQVRILGFTFCLCGITNKLTFFAGGGT